MPPIRRTRKNNTSSSKTAYETPIVKILVGEEEAMFPIHAGLLSRTTFFVEHGQPVTNQIPERVASLTGPLQAETQSIPSAETFLFGEREQTVESEAEQALAIDLTDEDADYVLKNKFFYSRDAFLVLIRYLNDALPVVPKNSKECLSLFKAYALAEHYHVHELQNQIIGVLQMYYRNESMPVKHLLFVVDNRIEDVVSNLEIYLTAQIAYEMATDYNQFCKDNENEMEKLFDSHRRTLIERLFESTMIYAKPLPSADPAKHTRNFRVNMNDVDD